MSSNRNGTAQNQYTLTNDAAVAAHQTLQLSSQMAAIINVAGDLDLDDGTTILAIAHRDLTMNDGGGVFFVAGEDFHLINGGCAGVAAGRDFAMHNGGCGFVLAGRDLHFANGEGAVSVAGQRATATGHQSVLVAARDVALQQSTAGVVVAGHVTLDGDATVVVEVTPERIAGALVGLIFYVPVRLLQKLRGK